MQFSALPWREGWSPKSSWTSTRTQNPSQCFSVEKFMVLTFSKVPKNPPWCLLNYMSCQQKKLKIVSSICQASCMPMFVTLQVFQYFLRTIRCLHRSEISTHIQRKIQGTAKSTANRRLRIANINKGLFYNFPPKKYRLEKQHVLSRWNNVVNMGERCSLHKAQKMEAKIILGISSDIYNWTWIDTTYARNTLLMDITICENRIIDILNKLSM